MLSVKQGNLDTEFSCLLILLDKGTRPGLPDYEAGALIIIWGSTPTRRHFKSICCL